MRRWTTEMLLPVHTGWRLPTHTNSLNTGFGTNWGDVPGANQTNVIAVPINAENGGVFFRLVFP